MPAKDAAGVKRVLELLGKDTPIAEAPKNIDCLAPLTVVLTSGEDRKVGDSVILLENGCVGQKGDTTFFVRFERRDLRTAFSIHRRTLGKVTLDPAKIEALRKAL